MSSREKNMQIFSWNLLLFRRTAVKPFCLRRCVYMQMHTTWLFCLYVLMHSQCICMCISIFFMYPSLFLSTSESTNSSCMYVYLYVCVWLCVWMSDSIGQYLYINSFTNIHAVRIYTFKITTREGTQEHRRRHEVTPCFWCRMNALWLAVIVVRKATI